LWVARGDIRRLKLAAVCQFTLAAPPVIYYGTEVGLSQLRDVRQNGRGILEESRLPMPWGDAQDRTLFNFYKQLIALRQSSTALRTGSRTLLIADPDTGRYGYRRDAEGESIAVLMNVSDKAQGFDLPEGSWRNALTDESLGNSVMIEGYGYLIARRD
jgi:glycosidase